MFTPQQVTQKSEGHFVWSMSNLVRAPVPDGVQALSQDARPRQAHVVDGPEEVHGVLGNAPAQGRGIVVWVLVRS